jgi:ATP-binding cassette subfamily B protein RaxB
MPLNPLELLGRDRLPIVLQTEVTECGLACLAMVASYHGHRIDLITLRQRYPVSLRGMTPKGLAEVAGQLKLHCRAVRFELCHLAMLRLPAVLHWDMDHVVVLKAVTRRGILVHDPALGKRFYPLAEASRRLTGLAFVLTPSVDFARKKERARLSLTSFWARTQGTAPALVQIFVLSVLLEIFVVASPFYMKLVVDEVIDRSDGDLLLALALGFSLLTAISVASTALRSYILLMLQSVLSHQMAADLFRHLVRLPITFFERWSVGEILSRFSSIEPIRNLLSQGLIAAVIDGAMALATLVMIFVCGAELACVVLVAVALYAILRAATYQALQHRSASVIAAKAKVTSTLVETLRAMLSLRVANREPERVEQWTNEYVDVTNATIRVGRINIAFKTMDSIVLGAENILTIYLAARLTQSGSLSYGMMFAFISYKRHFTEKAVLLVEKLIELRSLDLHLERIAGIVLTPPERGHDRTVSQRSLGGGIELRDVSFRFTETEPFVLQGLSLTIVPREFVAITGPFGCGKTTLLKIMLGLLSPTSGEILIDGTPLPVVGPQVFREQVGAVMQNDQLFSRSIADNIRCFSEVVDREWMEECARMAAIHDDIMAMPMDYNTLVGDMGSSLSGGQKQCVLLARALYRRPKILFLDEGTAHLDVDTERRINEMLRRLDITRISIAHRPETLRAADRVIRISPVASR